MSRLPVITGVGLRTPLGRTVGETWKLLLEGRGITDHSRAAGTQGVAAEPFARIDALAVSVAREALAQARWGADERASAGLIIGTSKGPADAWLETLDRGVSGRQGGETHSVPSCEHWGLAQTAAVVGAMLELRGPRLSMAGACAGGLIALVRAAMMIQSGEAERVLIVAAESSLHRLFLGSFERLGVLAPIGFGCRPFDKTRAGFVVSEAAAAVCLESAAVEHSTPDAIRLERFALGADATHLTGIDPSAIALNALLQRVIDGRPVDLFHAHGTGTLANDPAELSAIAASLPASSMSTHIYSHKAALGHSLGAAGLVAVVINCMAHRHGVIPANINTTTPLPADGVRIDSEMTRRGVSRSVAAAAGFGGAIAAVSLISAPTGA